MQGGHSTASPANQTYIEPYELELDISDYIEPHELDISDYIEPHIELDTSEYTEPHELGIFSNFEYIEPYSELDISTPSSTSSTTASSTSRPPPSSTRQTSSEHGQPESSTSSSPTASPAITYEDDNYHAHRHGRSPSSTAVGTLHPYALSKGCTSSTPTTA